MGFQEDINNFMVQDGDRQHNGVIPEYYPVTPIYSDCSVLPLIDGKAYFEDLYNEIQRLGSTAGSPISEQFIYIHAWVIDLELKLTETSPTLLKLLHEKAREGIDVRILVWANDFLLDSSTTIWDFINAAGRFYYNVVSITPYIEYQYPNLLSLQRIREVAPEIQIIVNYLDHEYGASHMKMVLISSGSMAYAYTGGIDLSGGRRGNPLHREGDGWHDIQAKVCGPVVQEIYDVYIALWNEIINKEEDHSPVYLLAEEMPELFPEGFQKIKAKTPDNNMIERKEINSETTANHYCQSLFTLPNNAGNEKDIISFAQEGWYQIRLALHKAINNAKDYIYIEDQAFASREIFDLLKNALIDASRPNLRLIMVTGSTDPDDKPSTLINKLHAMNDFLLKGLNDEQRGRIVLFEHYVVVHSKVWIIDDKWAMIGSANVLNRALYTEIDHCISFMNEANTVALLRVNLWGEHFGIPPNERVIRLTDLQNGLNVWNPNWGAEGSGIKLLCYAQTIGDIPDVEWDGIFKPYLLPKLTMANATSGSKTHITSDYIPESSENNFFNKDYYVHIYSGPNNDCIRKLTNHLSRSIYFDEMPDANYNSTAFSIFRPRIDKVELPAYEEDKLDNIDCIKLEWVQDYGEAP